MVQNKPIRLNQEWVISTKRNIYIVKLDNEINCYCKTQEAAEELIQSLGDNIQNELQKEKAKTAEITKALIKDENTGSVTKVVIYEKALGYVYNSSPKVKHTLTYVPLYKGYYNPNELMPELREEVIINIADNDGSQQHEAIELQKLDKEAVTNKSDAVTNKSDDEEQSEDDESDETNSEESTDEAHSTDDFLCDMEKQVLQLMDKVLSFLA
jgi:hypothetical protein